LNLAQCAQEIQHRLIHLFVPDADGNRACHGENVLVNQDPHFKDYVPFYEYFDGDTGRGLGASHQCGWTAVVAKWIHDNGTTCRTPKTPKPSTQPVRRNSIHSFETENESALSQEEDDDELLEKFAPKAGPFPGRLVRRRSGKSLLNLTIQSLDLGDDEDPKDSEPIAGFRDLKNVTAEMGDLKLSKSVSNQSADSRGHDQNLMSQIRSAFKKYKNRTDEDEADEFETRH
ncbi:hypothetical protein OXX80_007764, partial [Metschnikowia pulcherrima]